MTTHRETKYLILDSGQVARRVNHESEGSADE